MEMMARRVDWSEAVRRHESGSLHATINEALDRDESWVQYHELPNDSFALCGDVSEAYGRLRPHLAPEVRELADTLLGAAVWAADEGNPPNDLGEEASPDAFYCALSPERVASLADISRRLSWSLLATAADACPEEVWEDCSYEEDFVPFVDQFRALFEAAARDGRGVLIFVG